MSQPLSLGLVIVVALAVDAQTAIPVKPDQPSGISTANEQVLRVLTILRQKLPSAQPTRAEVERVLADDYVSIDEAGQPETKAQALQKCCDPEAVQTLKTLFFETQLAVQIKDVDSKVYGNTAFAHYKIEARLVINGEPVVKTFNSTEALVKRDGRWQSVMHTETVMPGKVVGAKIDPKIYDDYVGKYRLTPSIIYTVSRAGDKLLWGRDHTELAPESETTFLKTSHIPDVLYRIIFVRSNEGRVTHIRLREYPGVEYSAMKIQ